VNTEILTNHTKPHNIKGSCVTISTVLTQADLALPMKLSVQAGQDAFHAVSAN
jgi:hypothetical protein